MARAMPRRSPFTRVMPALSIATSVPVPIAMPTSAAASAGASLMPSPAMATICPLRVSASIARVFSARVHAGLDFIEAELLARRRRAVCSLSPVSMTIFSPSSCSDWMASGVESLIGSATATSPAALTVQGDEDHGLALRWRGSAAAARASRPLTPSALEKVELADEDFAALDPRGDAAARWWTRKSYAALSSRCAFLRAGDDGGSERMLALLLDGGGGAEQ